MATSKQNGSSDDSEHPWRNEELLRELYHREGLTQSEIADRLGTVASTISRWMNRLGIEARRPGGERKPGATYRVNDSGRPYWNTNDPEGSSKGVFVHQLTAIAYGADSAEVFADETQTHHKNNCPFDNRPDNLELLSGEEHREIHNGVEEWAFDADLGCRVLVGGED